VILGREYVINTRENRRHTEEVADFVNRYCEEIGEHLQSRSKVNIITMAALHIADDFLRMKKEYKKLMSRIDGKSQELERILEA